MTWRTPYATPDFNVDKTCNYLGTRCPRRLQSLHLCSWRTDYELLKKIEWGDVGLKVRNPLVWFILATVYKELPWTLVLFGGCGFCAVCYCHGSRLYVLVRVPNFVLPLQSIPHRICFPVLCFVITLRNELKISISSDIRWWKNCVIFSQNMVSDVHFESWKSISVETDNFLFLCASSL